MPKQPLITGDIRQLLEHVHSLHIVSTPDRISLRDADTLIQLGYLRACWINNYTLTEAGERARRGQS